MFTVVFGFVELEALPSWYVMCLISDCAVDDDDDDDDAAPGFVDGAAVDAVDDDDDDKMGLL